AVDVLPKPATHLDIWLGGQSPAGFRRIGRYADGWLGSFVTPTEAHEARLTIEAAAKAAGREVPDDHYGINLAVGDGELPEPVVAAIRKRRPDLDPTQLVAADWSQLHRQIDEYIDAGLTKFVIRPAGRATLTGFLDTFVSELLPREN
ncbi:TIGR03854 family LLM class F420-dependent oxidoreductase, partial [Mycobacterium sp. ITM-2017-0098]